MELVSPAQDPSWMLSRAIVEESTYCISMFPQPLNIPFSGVL